MQLRQIARLDDWYRFEPGTLFITGLQALVRLLLAQSYRDRAAGLHTAGFVSGYRGSPLGGLDRELWRAGKSLDAADIRFQPGLNEDLAATSIWGSQQTNLFPGARYDGVFSLWYGKGPGVDRSGDALKHGNAAGTSAHGGVLVVAGDDHTCRSSSLPHQSEYNFIDALIPVLNPADVSEIVELGLYGFALSRFSGCWIGLKVIARNGRCDAVVRAIAAGNADRDAGLRYAARRPQHPLAGSAERSGVPPPAAQAARGARVRACERSQPHGDRGPHVASRHRDDR